MEVSAYPPATSILQNPWSSSSISSSLSVIFYLNLLHELPDAHRQISPSKTATAGPVIRRLVLAAQETVTCHPSHSTPIQRQSSSMPSTPARHLAAGKGFHAAFLYPQFYGGDPAPACSLRLLCQGFNQRAFGLPDILHVDAH